MHNFKTAGEFSSAVADVTINNPGKQKNLCWKNYVGESELFGKCIHAKTLNPSEEKYVSRCEDIKKSHSISGLKSYNW